MPLFKITQTDSLSPSNLSLIELMDFKLEKDLQTLIEANLGPVFGCRFVATEFPTGEKHAGRIDTLALSQENYPTIIEYKKKVSAQLITQSLFYLDWMRDHKGDFEKAVRERKELGETKVEWDAIRVICLAPDYTKYDRHAANVIPANLELWTYRLFNNDSLYISRISHMDSSSRSPLAHAGENKASSPRKTEAYTVEEHLSGKSSILKALAQSIREFVLDLDSAIEEVPRKKYIAYAMSRNIVCMGMHKDRVCLYVSLDPKEINAPRELKPRNMADKGHYGTGDLELSLTRPDHLELAKPLLEQAYRKIGG